MAERRMFAKTIIDSDAFLGMPLSAQALYFHLSMRADDEGFVNSPKKIMRMIGANDGDIEQLIIKRYLIVFDSGVVVIKHWRIHNYIQSDRFKPTLYQEERNEIELKDNKSYTEKSNQILLENDDVYNLDTERIHSIGKYSIGKVSIDKISIDEYKDILSFWNNQKIVQHRKLSDTMKGRINSKLEDYTLEEIKQAILNYSYILQSDDYFLDYRWTLVEFMDRGFEKMLVWETAEKSYRRNNAKTKSTNPYMEMQFDENGNLI